YCLASLLFLLSSQDLTPELAERLIEQLGSKEERWREEALGEIRKLVPSAPGRALLRKELDKAAKGNDEQVRTLAKDLLQRLEIYDQIPKRLGQIKGVAESLFDGSAEEALDAVARNRPALGPDDWTYLFVQAARLAPPDDAGKPKTRILYLIR